MAKNEIEGIVLLLDVGMTMSTRVGSNSYLQSCVDIMQMIIQRKMFQSSKDEFALVLFGTNETANRLWDGSSDDYSHVTLARHLGVVDWKLMNFLQNNINVTNIQGDILDGVIVASDHFHEEHNKKKVFKEKRIMIFSDLSSRADDDDKLNEICRGLAKHSIRVDLISPFNMDDQNDDENERKTSRRSNDPSGDQASASNSHNDSERKVMTREQMQNQKILKQILDSTDGAMYSFDEVLTLLSMYQAKAIKSMGTKFAMTIGENFKMPIVSVIKVQESKPDLFKLKKVYAKDDTVELKTDRARFTKDEEQRDLDDKTDVIDAYRYGSSYVPIDSAETLRLEVEKCFSVLGFTKSENVKRHYFVGNSVNQIIPDAAAGPEVEEAFVNLVHAMYDENVYGIVRRVYSSRSAPELGCLIPHIDSEVVCLLYIALPFEDDVRKFTLENFTIKKKLAPTENQLKLVDDLIDSMDLTPSQQRAIDAGETKNGNDDDEEEEELYDPKITFNPYIQRMFQAIALRATNPDAELPDFEHNITNSSYIRTQQKVYSDSTVEALKRLNDEFAPKLVESNKKQKVKDAQSIFESNDKKSEKKDDDDVNKENEADKSIELNDLLNANENVLSKPKKLGSLTPVEDFKRLVDGLKKASADDDSIVMEFAEYCKQIQNIIKEIFNESLIQSLTDSSLGASSLDASVSMASNSLQEKVFNCIKIQRDYCIKFQMIEVFNSYLKSFKSYLLNQMKTKVNYSKQIRQFWQDFFIKHKMTLITKSECSDSYVSDEESDKFLQGFEKEVEAEVAKPVKVVEEDNEEDLLDLM